MKISVKSFVYSGNRENEIASDLLEPQKRKYREDGSEDWTGVPDGEWPQLLNIEAEGMVILEQ